MADDFSLFDPAAAVAAEAQSVASRSQSVAAPAGVVSTSALLLKAAVDARSVATVASVATCREGVRKLAALPQPGGIGPLEWKTLVADAQMFERCWLEQAVACGWTVEEMFGCPPRPASSRVDCMGIVPLLGGFPIGELDERSATIVTRRQVIQRYYLYPWPGSYRFDRSAAAPIWIAYDVSLIWAV